jgi:hypothetical protein
MEFGQLLSTTVQDAIIYHLLVLYKSQLVQTYFASTTKHYPMRKKFVNLNFERVSYGLYFVVEGFFNQKVQNLRDFTFSLLSKIPSLVYL